MRIRLIGLVAVCALVAACGGDSDSSDEGSSSSEGDTEVVIAVPSEPTTLDPQISDSQLDRVVTSQVYETLLERNDEGELEPLLAAEMPESVADDTWEFKLRPDITFHNGEPFNAASVAYSVKRIIDPALESLQISFYETIVDAEAVDDLTVRITTDGRDPLLPTRMYWMTMVPENAGDDPDFGQTANGTGPYRLSEWNHGQSVVLDRNAEYWGDEPDVDRVVVRPIPEAGTQIAALQSGEADLVLNISPEAMEEVPVAKSQKGSETYMLRLESGDGPLSDLRVRQAIDLAIDREALAENLFNGLASPAPCQITVPQTFGFNPDLEPAAYDPDQARQLLEEAGAVGTTLSMNSLSGRFVRDRETAEAVVQYLQDAGFEVDLQFPDIPTFVASNYTKELHPDLLLVSSSNELYDADRQMNYLVSSSGNSGFSNAEVDELAESARSELDVDKRAEEYQRIAEIVCEESGNVYLLNPDDLYGLSDRLDWEPRADGLILAQSMSLKG